MHVSPEWIVLGDYDEQHYAYVVPWNGLCEACVGKVISHMLFTWFSHVDLFGPCSIDPLFGFMAEVGTLCKIRGKVTNTTIQRTWKPNLSNPVPFAHQHQITSCVAATIDALHACV
jgi:hypothetical protein